MKKYVATENRVLSVMNRNLAIAEGMEMFENSFTTAFPKYFKEIGEYSPATHTSEPQLITEVKETPVEPAQVEVKETPVEPAQVEVKETPVEPAQVEVKEELLIDDSSDVQIVIEPTKVEAPKPTNKKPQSRRGRK